MNVHVSTVTIVSALLISVSISGGLFSKSSVGIVLISTISVFAVVGVVSAIIGGRETYSFLGW